MMNKNQINKKTLMVYIHIPFCIKKCSYCDFLSFENTSDEADCKNAYINALCSEIRAFENRAKDRRVTSVFIGGGTPSVLDGRHIKKVCDAIYDVFDISRGAEFSIECNPGTVTEEKLEMYRECGINRISFGLQSADNEELHRLGRIHTYEDFLESYGYARKSGFKNINIDLMSAIPGQTFENWSETLKKVVDLKPEHISAYSLIIEEGTLFYDLYTGGDSSGIPPLPDEDTEREMYYLTKQILNANGYERYEISNYSRSGFECRHNCGYWQGTDYAGFGLGAASLFDGYRYSDTRDIKKYISCEWMDGESVHLLSEKERMEEFMFLGLRMDKGISAAEFENRFSINIQEIYGSRLKRMSDMGLMILNNGNWRLTDCGVDLSNRVLAEFLF